MYSFSLQNTKTLVRVARTLVNNRIRLKRSLFSRALSVFPRAGQNYVHKYQDLETISESQVSDYTR